MTEIGTLGKDELEALHDAAAMVLAAQQGFAARGASPVSDVIGSGRFEEWGHYPTGDARDDRTGSLYYYHAHAAHERAEGEHGHFHIFVRPPGGTDAPRPDGRYPGAAPGDPARRFAHLVALSMDAHGRPFRLFATNRWVTDETWYPAETVIDLIARFGMDGGGPSVELDRWLTGMVRLYRPRIAGLLRERDRAIEAAALERGTAGLLEDRSLQNLAEAPVDLLADISEIEAALGLR